MCLTQNHVACGLCLIFKGCNIANLLLCIFIFSKDVYWDTYKYVTQSKNTLTRNEKNIMSYELVKTCPMDRSKGTF